MKTGGANSSMAPGPDYAIGERAADEIGAPAASKAPASQVPNPDEAAQRQRNRLADGKCRLEDQPYHGEEDWIREPGMEHDLIYALRRRKLCFIRARYCDS